MLLKNEGQKQHVLKFQQEEMKSVCKLTLISNKGKGNKSLIPSANPYGELVYGFPTVA